MGNESSLPAVEEDPAVAAADAAACRCYACDAPYTASAEPLSRVNDGDESSTPPLVAELVTELGETFLSHPHLPATFNAYGGRTRALSRFLEAQQGDVANAALRFTETFAFRCKHSLHLDMETSEEEAAVRTRRAVARVLPIWLGGFSDRLTADGSPCSWFDYTRVDGMLGEADITDAVYEDFYVWFMEQSLRRQARANVCGSCGAVRQGPWKGMVEFHDMVGLSVTHLGYLGQVRRLAGVLSLGQQHYPDSLRKCIMTNAPRLFSGVWNIVSVVLAEATTAKTSILSSEVGDDAETAKLLSSYICWKRAQAERKEGGEPGGEGGGGATDNADASATGEGSGQEIPEAAAAGAAVGGTAAGGGAPTEIDDEFAR